MGAIKLTYLDENANQHLQYFAFAESFIDQRATSHDIRFKFTGKERDSETGFDYFGARYYNSDISVWLSVDPMSDMYPSMSAYMYTAGNPVMLVDSDGRDMTDFGVKKNGEVKQIGPTNNEPDRLFSIDNNNNKVDIDNDGKMTKGKDFEEVTDKAILPELSKDRQNVTKEDAEGTVIDNGTLRHASSSNKKEMANIFTFLAKNTEVEWSMYSTKDGNFVLGTYQFDDLAPSVTSYGLYAKYVKVGIHSHPNENSLESEVGSLFGDRSVVKRVPYSYYIFMGKSSNLYLLSSDGKKASRHKNVSPSDILKIMK